MMSMLNQLRSVFVQANRNRFITVKVEWGGKQRVISGSFFSVWKTTCNFPTDKKGGLWVWSHASQLHPPVWGTHWKTMPLKKWNQGTSTNTKVHEKVQFVLGCNDFEVDLNYDFLWFVHIDFLSGHGCMVTYTITRSTKSVSPQCHVSPEVTWSSYPLPSNSHHPDFLYF